MDEVEYVDELMGELRTGLDALLARGVPLRRESAHALAARMLAAVPGAHVYDELVGPFHTTGGVQTLLGITRQAVHERVKRGTLLRVLTSDEVALYPAFQFCGAQVSPPLRRVLATFRETPVDGWTVAAWLCVPCPELDDLSPRDWLADTDRDPTAVLALASEAAARWAQP